MPPGVIFQPIFRGSGVAPFAVQFIRYDKKKNCVVGSTLTGAVIIFECVIIAGIYMSPVGTAGVVISNLNLGGPNPQLEYVQIQNFGIAPVDMTGWTIRSQVGGQVYTFPSGYILPPGGTVFVTSGALAVNNPPTFLLWTNQNVWNNNGDTAVLVNAQGQVISQFTAPPLVGAPEDFF